MYVPLHNRSAFSFGSAITIPEHLPAFAAHYRLPAVALTDCTGLYAAVPFQQACEAMGIKPIFGAEFPLANGPAVTLLAMSLRGYGNLCRLISRYHRQDGTLGMREVVEGGDDLICIAGRERETGCGTWVREGILAPAICRKGVREGILAPAAGRRAGEIRCRAQGRLWRSPLRGARAAHAGRYSRGAVARAGRG